MAHTNGLRGIDSLVGWQHSNVARKSPPRSGERTRSEPSSQSDEPKGLKKVAEEAARFLAKTTGLPVSEDGVLSAGVMRALRTSIAADVAEENLRAAGAPAPSALKNAYGRAAAAGRITPFAEPRTGNLRLG